MAQLKGTKTEANLQAAFAGESQARNKYTYYASKAKKDGYVQIAKIFEETANNEKEHAKIYQHRFMVKTSHFIVNSGHLNFPGVTEKCFLKTFPKYAGSLKPRAKAISESVCFFASSISLARSIFLLSR